MGALRFSTILLGFLMIFGGSPEIAVAAPITAARAQDILDHLPAGADYRDQAVYAATRAELNKKVEEARQFPERADAILKDLWVDSIKYSPIAGYDPANNARTAAALECYIEVANGVASKQAPAAPQPARPTPPPPPPPDRSADEQAPVIVDEIIKNATSGGVIDTGKFFPGSANTNTNTNTNTGTRTGTGTNINTGLRTGAHDNSNSTITGLKSGYQPVTRSAAQDIVGRYKSIPGGVTLEGASQDLSFIRSAVYVAWANAFVLTGNVVYLNPLSAGEFVDIYRALAADDKLGVSMGSQLAIVYGALPPQSEVATNLQLADTFLGDIAFGNHRVTNGYVFAPGYEAKTHPGGSNIAVYFNIHDFRFARDASGQLSRSGASLDMTLVPLATKASDDGGHLPDLEKIDKGDIVPEYVSNVNHLQSNIGYYARERIVRTAFAYGEAAAFVRALKANGVKLDLDGLVKEASSSQASVKPASPAARGEGCELAAAHWSSVESIGTRLAYEDHLARFPGCAFATLAAARIAALDQKAPPDGAKRPQPKSCGAGFTQGSDGDCVRDGAGGKANSRKVTARATTRSPAAGGSNPALDCTNPVGLLNCVNRAILQH